MGYKRLLAWMTGKPANGLNGPGLYSLHDASGAARKHASHVEAFNSLFDEPIPLSSFDAPTLERYQRAFLKEAKKVTVKTAFIKIKALSKWLHLRRYLGENPSSRLPAIKVSDDLAPDHLTEDEVARLFELVEKATPYGRNRDCLVFGLMIYAGFRRIECVRVKWSDIDLDKRVLIVRNGKGGKHRLIAINDKLHEILSSATRFGKHVLSSREGKPLKRAALTRVAEWYLKKLNHEYQGKKRFSLHALRATFATRLCEKGVSTRIVQGLLGHSDPKTTLRYAAVSEAAAMDAVQRL
jgi:site-specific recombinase XerD